MADGSEIYFIGGAPCGGKSTAARAICSRHGFRAFELDKNLERYTHLGMLEGNALLRAAATAAPQDIDALPPCQQCRQELEIYRQLCLIPEPAFQRARYRERPWVAQLLAQTPDPEQTFNRWMARNALLSREICAQAQKQGYTCLTANSASTPEDTLRQAEAALKLL